MSNQPNTSPSSVFPSLGARFQLRRVVNHEVGIGATVYLAYDLHARREVLVVLSNNEHASPQVDPLRDWIPILRHPGLVDVVGTQQPGERPYLVLGLPEGASLGSIVAQYGRYGVTSFANIGAQLLATISHLHEEGLVHGALHLDNIYISGRDPHTARVTVADAHRCARAPRPAPVSDNDKTCLALRHELDRLAPHGTLRPLDPRDDVFALGTVFRSIVDLSHERLDGDEPARRRLRALCDRCTSSSPSRRPAHAGEVLRAFYRCFEARSDEPRSRASGSASLVPSGGALAVDPSALPSCAGPTPVNLTPTWSAASSRSQTMLTHRPLVAAPVVSGLPGYPAVQPGWAVVPPPPVTPAAMPVSAAAVPAAVPVSAAAVPAAVPNPAAYGQTPRTTPRSPHHARSGPRRSGRMFGLAAALGVSVGVLLAWPQPELAKADVPVTTRTRSEPKATPAQPTLASTAAVATARPTSSSSDERCSDPRDALATKPGVTATRRGVEPDARPEGDRATEGSQRARHRSSVKSPQRARAGSASSPARVRKPPPRRTRRPPSSSTHPFMGVSQ